MIPRALLKFSSATKYITFNLNKKLTRQFNKKIKKLKKATGCIDARVIEDDATNAKRYFDSECVDIVIFEHSVNDILQTMLAEDNGINTAKKNWFAILPQMIELINKAYLNKELDNLKQRFLGLIQNCASVLKSGGYMVFSHYMFQLDLDWGYNETLWENMLTVIKPWLSELTAFEFVDVNDFSQPWWLIVRKHDK